MIAPELGIALPGLSLVCCDSHTCTLGGLGTLAFGPRSTEGVHVLATQTLVQAKPLRMRVALTGRPQSCVTAKDIILSLIGKIGASGGNGYAVEFARQTISKMSVESRLTLCNMSIEFTAKYGFVSPDDVTFQYLAGRDYSPKGRLWDQALDYWRRSPLRTPMRCSIKTCRWIAEILHPRLRGEQVPSTSFPSISASPARTMRQMMLPGSARERLWNTCSFNQARR